MSKKGKYPLLLALLIIFICYSASTSLGQESSSFPNELSNEDVIEHAQRSLDRSIGILNIVATLIAVLVALLTVLVVIGVACGFLEYSRWQKFRDQAKKSAEEAKKSADDAKKASEEVKPIIYRLKKAEEEIEPLRKKFEQFPLLPKSISEDEKKTLEEYGRRIEFLEAFGLPLTFEDYMSRANDHYYKGAYELALIALDKAIELKPDHAKAWSNKGVVLENLGRHEEALEAHEKAIELKPDHADAWNNKGATLFDLGRYEEALAAYDKAIDLKPDNAKAWYNKAGLYSLIGDKENALENLSKAIELDAKYKERAKGYEDFRNLWDDEDFLKIVS